MTDAAEEFADLMPHKISVRSLGSVNNFGKQAYDDNTKREYICLVEDDEVVSRSTEGVAIGVHLTAYCPTIPTTDSDNRPSPDKGTPWEIKDNDEITIIDPPGYPVRPLVSVAHYYDETGVLYAQVVRLT